MNLHGLPLEPKSKLFSDPNISTNSMTFYKSRIYAGFYGFTPLLILPQNSLFCSLYYLRLMSALMSKIIFLDVPTHLVQSVYYTVISPSSTPLTLANNHLSTNYSNMENGSAPTHLYATPFVFQASPLLTISRQLISSTH